MIICVQVSAFGSRLFDAFASSTHERETYRLRLYTAAAMERMQLFFELR